MEEMVYRTPPHAHSRLRHTITLQGGKHGLLVHFTDEKTRLREMKGLVQGHMVERNRTRSGPFPVSPRAVIALFSRAAFKGTVIKG